MSHNVITMSTWDLIVSGSRTGHCADWSTLDRIATARGKPRLIHVGDEPNGVDRRTKQWALANGYVIGDSLLIYVARWFPLGLSAGPARNEQMVDAAIMSAGRNRPLRLIAFPVGQSPGTRGCMSYAAKRGVPVYWVGLSGKVSEWR